MSQLDQKGFTHIFILLILLLAVPIGLYLVQHPAIFKPKAEEIAQTASAGAYGSTPITDIDKYPKVKNGVKVDTLVAFGKERWRKETIDFIKKEVDYMDFGHCGLTSPQPWAQNNGDLDTILADLKSANPNIITTITSSSTWGVLPCHMFFNDLTDADILHQTDGEAYPYGTNDHPFKYINLSQATIRDKYTKLWVDYFLKHPLLDGIVLDDFGPLENVRSQGCLENCSALDFWVHGMVTESEKLKDSLGKEVFYNGLFYEMDPYKQIQGVLRAGLVDFTTGVLSEHQHRIIVSPEIFKAYMQEISTVVKKNKKVIVFIQPQILKQTDPQFSFSNDLNLERFYLASYLLIQNNPYTFFGYHPDEAYGGNNIYFYKDWNLNYGDPLGDYQETGEGLYYRVYTNGVAVVNPTDRYLVYNFPDPENYYQWSEGNTISSSVSAPPKSGNFYFKKPQLSLASPTPSAVSSPALAKKGDLNSDGKVDFKDFSILLSKWGTKDKNADLNGDGKVNTADLSVFLSNFGK